MLFRPLERRRCLSPLLSVFSLFLSLTATQSLPPPTFLVRPSARGEFYKAGVAAISILHLEKHVLSGNVEEESGTVAGRQAGWCKSVVLSEQTFVWPTIDWGTSGKSAVLHATYHCPPLVTLDVFFFFLN